MQYIYIHICIHICIINILCIGLSRRPAAAATEVEPLPLVQAWMHTPTKTTQSRPRRSQLAASLPCYKSQTPILPGLPQGNRKSLWLEGERIRRNCMKTDVYEEYTFGLLFILGRFALLGWIRADFAVRTAILILTFRHFF